MFFINCMPNSIFYIHTNLERFGHVRRTDNDIIKKVLTETIQKKIPILDYVRDGKMLLIDM